MVFRLGGLYVAPEVNLFVLDLRGMMAIKVFASHVETVSAMTSIRDLGFHVGLS